MLVQGVSVRRGEPDESSRWIRQGEFGGYKDEEKGGAMLDFRVKTFLSVCRLMNYTHAARELSLTQSAVSQHMAALE